MTGSIRPVARKLVGDLLDLHDITDRDRPSRERSQVVLAASGRYPATPDRDVSHPLGPGGPTSPIP